MKPTPKSKLPLVKRGIELAFQKRLEREKAGAEKLESTVKAVRPAPLNIEN
jgi:hypothetical protein